MSWKEQLASVAQRMRELYDETIQTRVRFEALDKETHRMTSELREVIRYYETNFRNLEARLNDQVNDLRAQVAALQGRVNGTFDNATLIVAKEGVKEATFQALRGTRGPESALGAAESADEPFDR